MFVELGTAKVDITPSFPVELAGFASRQGKGPYNAVTRPLYARVLFFRSGASSAVLVSADVLCWDGERAMQLRERIRERWGADEVILNATHTHSGPQIHSDMSPLVGAPDERYVRELEGKLMEAVGSAAAGLEPVTAERGSGECGIAMNRRLRFGGRVVIGTNEQGPVDREATVIRFAREDGGTKAVLVHYACHPVVASANAISSEFVGAAMERLEETLGDGAVAAYLQGACGDINPSADGRLISGGDAEVLRLGEQLAEEVIRVLHSGKMKRLDYAAIRTERRRIELPLQPLPARERLSELSTSGGIAGDWSRRMLEAPGKLRSSVPLEIAYVRLAAGLSFVAMNAEPVVEYGLHVKQASGGRALLLGYSNGMIGYVSTAAQLDEGGYEPVESTPYFYLPAPFDRSVEAIVKKELEHFASL